jgi:hypothetical protein
MEKYKYSGDGVGIYIYIVLGLFVNFLCTPKGFFFFIINVGIRMSLRATRLISRALKLTIM